MSVFIPYSELCTLDLVKKNKTVNFERKKYIKVNSDPSVV